MIISALSMRDGIQRFKDSKFKRFKRFKTYLLDVGRQVQNSRICLPLVARQVQDSKFEIM